MNYAEPVIAKALEAELEETYQSVTLLTNELTQSSELLRQSNEKLSELYRTAHQFVDNVSHEFRTPLTVIKEFASLMSEGLVGDVNDEQREYLNTIVHRVEDLALMVDDMLDISKLEAGLLSVHRRECTVGSIAERIRTTIERKAAATGVNLTIAIDESLPAVYCDPENIGRVVINLAVNACKFTAAGGEVSVWARPDMDQSKVVIGISDNGPGIAPENVQAIFERFEQVGGDVRGTSEGFGLGLNIAKELVQINLGDMNVESELGRGSTFSFSVPVFDLRKVLRRFLDRIDTFRKGFSHVSLISVRILRIDAAAVEETGDFLQNQIRRSDLLINAQPGSWLICAPANRKHLDKMFARITEALERTNRNRPGEPLPAIAFETKEIWDIGESSEAFLDCCDTELALQDM